MTLYLVLFWTGSGPSPGGLLFAAEEAVSMLCSFSRLLGILSVLILMTTVSSFELFDLIGSIKRMWCSCAELYKYVD